MHNYFFFYLLYKTPQCVRFFMSYLTQNVAFSVLCASQENNFTMGITDYVLILYNYIFPVRVTYSFCK